MLKLEEIKFINLNLAHISIKLHTFDSLAQAAIG